jgi:hypothetical protein
MTCGALTVFPFGNLIVLILMTLNAHLGTATASPSNSAASELRVSAARNAARCAASPLRLPGIQT